jgi:cardiolipin synthase
MPLFSKPKLLIASDYAKEATMAIRGAERRVAIVTTTLLADDVVSEALVDALCDAARRGVSVSIGADSLTYTEPKESVFAPHKRQFRARNSLKLEKRLRDAGAHFQWLGRLSTIGFAGRTHTKWCVVDDIAFSFGGVNLDKKSFMNVDYMFRYDDADVADIIFIEHERILRSDKNNSATRSRRHDIDKHTTILIDGGLFGDSIIYRRACSLAKKSKRVILVSQYCPTGRLARYLKNAESSELYFNHWRKAKWLNRLIIRLGMFFSKLTTGYHRRPYLHAKFIIFELKNGKKVAISGSHNFLNGGVLLGTREIAIETTDKAIIKQLEKFFIDYVV